MLVFAAAPTTSGAGEGKPCRECSPKTGTWDWKANGYGVAATPDEAKQKAMDRAKSDGCTASYRYLDEMKLACPSGCTAGAEVRSCEPKTTASCEVGSYAERRDMWQFVCRKVHGKAAATACSNEAATAAPHFAMCDVPLRATTTLPCESRCAAP
jgi:hypothetical protein